MRDAPADLVEVEDVVVEPALWPEAEGEEPVAVLGVDEEAPRELPLAPVEVGLEAAVAPKEKEVKLEFPTLQLVEVPEPTPKPADVSVSPLWSLMLRISWVFDGTLTNQDICVANVEGKAATFVPVCGNILMVTK